MHTCVSSAVPFTCAPEHRALQDTGRGQLEPQSPWPGQGSSWGTGLGWTSKVVACGGQRSWSGVIRV